MRNRIQFWLDRLPWWTWPVTAAFTWIACHGVGHVPMQNYNVRVGAYWHCVWCLKDVPKPTRCTAVHEDGITRCHDDEGHDGDEHSGTGPHGPKAWPTTPAQS